MKIGIVLSGGMAKGAYQVGALKALDNYLPKQELGCVSCSSVGVLNGYAYITDNLDRVELIWKDICRDGNRYYINQILKSSFLQDNIRNLYDENKPVETTFYCSLLDWNKRMVVYKDLSTVKSKDIPLYLKASVAMPVYNKSVKIDDTSYFDGAMIDNIPVYPLINHDLDYIIAIYFDDVCYKFENTRFDNKIIKITFPIVNMLKQSLNFNKKSIDEMIKNGYDRTMYLLAPIFEKGYDDKEFIYRRIEYINKNTKNKNLRLTGDVLVTNLNKVTQKLTKKKIL